ncbi:hypothetical protein ONZ45_g11748 [Pleurotus djamor]|nr:hypothetical protein ONZ45_g11748 [Pleurotus djamor]
MVPTSLLSSIIPTKKTGGSNNVQLYYVVVPGAEKSQDLYLFARCVDPHANTKSFELVLVDQATKAKNELNALFGFRASIARASMFDMIITLAVQKSRRWRTLWCYTSAG